MRMTLDWTVHEPPMPLNSGWILQFLQNICLFAAIVLCFREIIRAALGPRQRTVLLGLLFGSAAVIGVLLPVALPTGHDFDIEVLPIGLAALFGGPTTALITIAIADAFQLFSHGGLDLVHIVEPSIAGLIGAAFLLFERRRQRKVHLKGLLLLGVALAAMPFLEATLVDHEALLDLVGPALFYGIPSGLLGTAILGSLLRREDAILERERANAQESKMLEAVLESMSDGLLAVDTKGKFLVFNRPAQEMLGDWRGDKLDDWMANYKRFHLDGTTPMASEDLALPRALRGLETNDLNVIVRSPNRPDGFTVSVNGRPLRDDQGNVVAGITVVRDVSELMSAQKHLAESQAALKQSEERYALAFEGAYDGLWDWDLRTDQIYWSGRCMEMLGHASDIADRTHNSDWWLSLVHPDDAAPTLKALQDCLSGNTPSFAVEYRLRRADGTYCWVSDRGAVIRDANGHPYRAAGSLTDITARKLAEQRRRVLEGQLQQAQKIEALGTLAGGIAHDINNTLIPIIGTVDLMLLDAPQDSELSQGLQDVMNAAVRVKELVRQILAFSRHEGSERSVTDMGSELAATLRMLRSMVPATISLDLYARGEQFTCNVNKTQLHQIVMNLISNAVGAIGPNRGSIRVTLERIDVDDGTAIPGQDVDPGAFCRISVVDTGPGIPAAVRSRLFDPFFTTKPVGEGTGLGLSVVQGIVRDHGGFILVDNEPGEGARFDVHLPLADPSPAKLIAAQ
jgi:PAS domain S-box-containing protein